MKEIKSIINAYERIGSNENRCALATVVRVEGSSYRRMGARMIVMEDGTWIGGISGGCLEGDALRRALKAIHLQKPSIVTYDTSIESDSQVGVGLGCNGIIDVLFQPLFPHDHNNPVHLLKRLSKQREQQIILTVTQGNWSKDLSFGDTRWLHDIGTSPFSNDILKSIEKAKTTGKSQTIITENKNRERVQFFIEVLKPTLRLFIFGGNYDIYPLIRMGSELGWEVYVQARLQQLQQQAFDLCHKVFNESQPIEGIDERSILVLMSHDLLTDKLNLAHYIQSKTGYIGILGPRDRSERIINELKTEYPKIHKDHFAKLHYPVGLDLGAVNPEEITLSICAEIITHFSGRNGQPLKYRKGKIYE